MVLEWPVLPLPTPHTCSSWGIAIVSIKTTSILDLGPRMPLLLPSVSPGAESVPWGPQSAFFHLKLHCHHPFLWVEGLGVLGRGSQVLFKGFIGHGGGEHVGGIRGQRAVLVQSSEKRSRYQDGLQCMMKKEEAVSGRALRVGQEQGYEVERSLFLQP